MSIVSLLPSRPTDPKPPRARLAQVWDALDAPDSAALHGLLSGALWFVVGVSLGLLMSEELTMPDLFGGIAQLVFSRLRPAHVNIVLFGFLSTAFWGAWYFIVPRLCQTPLRSNRAANILLLVWNVTLVVATLALLNGDTIGKEYSEYPWYINFIVQAGLVVNMVIIWRTIAARREPKMFVSLWYIGGSVLWITILYAIGHVIWHPFTTFTAPDGHTHFLLNAASAVHNLPDGVTNFQRTGSIIGLDDAVWNWFYGHNVFGLYITTGGIAILYYLVPKISKRPLYSHTMSLIGFWSIALFYTNTGQHHLLQAPIPNWLKIVSVIGSVSLIIPVFTFTTNLMMTMRGEWGQMLMNIPLRYLLTGALLYLAVSFQGTVQSLMSVNRFVHFTQWTVAHAHLALLGAFGFIAMGATLYMVPQILRRPLWSRSMADVQYWLVLLGVTGYFWAITAAGLAQASEWVSLGQQVVRAYPVVKPYFVMRSWFGGIAVIGVIMQAINIFMTLLTPALTAGARRRREIAALQEMAPLHSNDDRVLVD